MTQPTADFAAQLHAQGYRLTPQRQLILEAVRQADDHVTPEEVYETRAPAEPGHQPRDDLSHARFFVRDAA